MTQVLTVRRLHSGDAGIAGDILARAFDNDPIAEWVFPDAAGRMEVGRAFFRLFSAFAIEAGEGFIDEAERGVGLWLPFDPAAAHEDDGTLGQQLAEACGPYADRLAILDELQQAAHPVHAVHAYLPFIGVDPAHQGQGVGGQLLRARTRELDAAGLPAYLEATTIQSVRLYERHGFRHMEQTIDLPDGPSLYPMWREPRA